MWQCRGCGIHGYKHAAKSAGTVESHGHLGSQAIECDHAMCGL